MFMSMTPLKAAIALLIYVAGCMLFLMFSAPDYAAEPNAFTAQLADAGSFERR